jgi:signal transduction histidine kinase
VTDRRTLHRLVDAGIAALLACIAVAEIWVPFTSVQGHGSEALSTAVVVLACAALVFRRVAPLPTALFVLFLWPVVFTAEPVLVLFWGQFVPMVVAVFSVARHGSGRRGLYGGAAAAATLLFLDLRVDVLQTPGEIVFHWLVFVAAWSVGRGLHVMERHAAESLRRAVEVEVASAGRAMAAVVEERTRIARELHDVVAHSVSVMVIQAGAAEQVVDDDPEHVRAALRTIRATGADALAEMRRVLTVLRDAEVVGALSPQPGLGELDVLVDEARSGGLEVALDVTGLGRTLPAGVDLAAYRIVQEALTNVRRHAAASRAEVRVRYGQDTLELEVHDDGTAQPASAGAAAGHGLVGMRERAALYGGRLEAKARDGGGFTVHAVLPLSPATAEVAPG